MLRRAVIAPRHYLEHSVAILPCKHSTGRLSPVQLRWGTAAAMSSQNSRASRREDTRVESSLDRRQSSPPNATTSSTSPLSSPEYFANAFTNFLEHYGKTTQSALHHLNSGLPPFSLIHELLQKPRNVRRVADFFAASAKPALCVRLLSLSVAYGSPPNAPIYEGVCWTLWQNKRYPLILEVCRLAKEGLGTLSGRLLNWRLRTLCHLESFVSIGAMMREFEDSGVKLSRRSWHLILIAQLRNRDLDGARRSLKLMEQAGFPADPTTHTVIAANYRYLGLDAQVRDLALSTLGSLPPSNRVFVINQLLEAQAQFGDEHGFHQLLLSFDSSSIEPLRVLLNPLDDAENSIIPLPALASPNPVTPDAHTFLVTIRFCITRSNLLAAEKIFSLMTQRAFNLSPTIIAAFFALQFALDRPGFAVFLASRLLTPGEFDDLYDQLGRCTPEPDWRFPFPASYLRPTVEVLNALMQGLLRTRGLGAARVILELMKRVNVEPDPYTMRILVHHLIHSEQASPSHVLRMLRHLSPLFRPSLRHLHPIMGRLLRDEKFRLFSSENTVTPFPTSLTELDLTNPAAGLGLEQSLGRPNLGRSLLQSLESRGVQGDSVMLELRMRCEAIVKRDAITAIDVYNDMLARGMTPSVYHIAALMQAFTRRGETDKAVEIMRSAKMKPNLVMYTILLQGYAYQGKPKAAVHIFKTMVTDGIQPDARAIYALCRAFVLARQLASARKLLGTLWTFVEPFPWKYTMLPLAKLLILLRSLDRRASASKRTMSSSRRAQLRRDLAQVVVAYKRSKGLPNALASSSSSVRQLTKKAIHVNRKA